MKVEVDVLGSPSLKSLRFLWTKRTLQPTRCTRAQELCESRGGCPGLPVPNSPYSLCGRKATLKDEILSFVGRLPRKENRLKARKTRQDKSKCVECCAEPKVLFHRVLLR